MAAEVRGGYISSISGREVNLRVIRTFFDIYRHVCCRYPAYGGMPPGMGGDHTPAAGLGHRGAPEYKHYKTPRTMDILERVSTCYVMSVDRTYAQTWLKHPKG